MSSSYRIKKTHTDEILIRVYEKLEKSVPENWLPQPVSVAEDDKEMAVRHLGIKKNSVLELEKFIAASSKMSRKEREDAEGEWLAIYGGEDPLVFNKRQLDEEIKEYDRLKKYYTEIITQKNTIGFESYGTGHYGTVYKVPEKNVVLKVTTDKSEAHFAACAIALANKDGWPPTIAKYYGVVDCSTNWHGKKVYALWREEAKKNSELSHSENEYLLLNVSRIKRLGDQVRRKIITVDALISSIDGIDSDIAQTVLYYINNGILLADVHANNVMCSLIDGRWMITDPGHAIILNKKWLDIKVRKI